MQRKLHHADSAAFFRAVEEGCYICNWAWRNYKWLHPQVHRASNPVRHTEYDLRYLPPVLPQLERSVKGSFPPSGPTLFIWICTAEVIILAPSLQFFLFPTTTSNCSRTPSKSMTKKSSNTKKLGSINEIRSNLFSDS